MKRKLVWICLLLIVFGAFVFAACENVNNETVTDAVTIANLKTEVGTAFDKLSFASDLAVDSERGVIAFTVENDTTEISLAEIKTSTVSITVSTLDGISVTAITLNEGVNVYSLNASSGNLSVNYTLKITRKAATADPAPSDSVVEPDPTTDPTTDPTEDPTTDPTVDPEPAHTHTFADVWSKDDDYHWHAATCEHTDEVKDRAAHDWQVTFTNPATETADGVTVSVCSVCAATKTEKIEKLQHTHKFGAWTTVTAATCKEKGEERRDCSECDAFEVRETDLDPDNHDYAASVTEPTCTEDGYTTYTCSRCTDSYVADEVAATGHKYGTWTTVTAATCKEKGEERRDCSACDAYEIRETDIDPDNHDYAASVTAPTCTERGYTTHTCSRCGDSYVDAYTDALGHTEVTDPAVSPTCTDSGLTEGKHCSVCLAVLLAQEVVSSFEHTEVIDEAVAPTCTETGLTAGKHCSVCNEVLLKQETVGALGHDYKAAVTAPTCTEQGYTTHTCSRCDASYVDAYTDALGHTEVTDPAVSPTCTESGLTEGKHCSVCSAVLLAQEAVSTLGHTEVIDAAVAPTCTETGLTAGKHCSACKAVLLKQETVGPLGHDYKAAVTAPTCIAGGYATYTCSRCSDSYVADEVAATGHKYGTWTTVTAATCKEKGEERRDCSSCDIFEVREIDIDPNNHALIHYGAKAPTCTAVGWNAYDSCSRCDYTTYVEIPAKGHAYASAWSWDSESHWHDATCGHNVKSNLTAHTFGDWIVDDAETGAKHHVCSVCGYAESASYRISFDLCGGSSVSSFASVTVRGFDASRFFYDVTKDGYTFRGWEYDGVKVLDEEGTLLSSPEMSAQMTFCAVFTQTAKLHIITNMPEAGTVTGAGEYAYDTEVDVAAHPYQGYEFVGWIYSNAVLSNQEDYRYKMWDRDVTITARFKLADFTLSLTSNREEKGLVFINPTGYNDLYEAEKEKSVTYTNTVTVAAYTKTATRFLGWFDEENMLVTTNAVFSFRMPNHDYSLLAKWDYFTISYVLNGGTNDESNPVTYSSESEVILFAAPTLDSYTFDAWYTDEEFTSPIAGIPSGSYDDVTLYAKWVAYTVTTNTNLAGAGTYTLKNEEKVSAGQSVTLTAETNVGYIWVGWYDGDEKVSEGDSLTYTFIMPEQNKSFTAMWTYYTVTTETNLDGAGSYTSKTDQKVTVGQSVTLTASTNAGYTWLGWYDGDTKVSEAMSLTCTFDMPAESKIYTAMWAVSEEMSNFTFTSTASICTITGIKDKSVTEIVVPEYVTVINSGAFADCSALTSIEIPSSVTSIGASAFSGCSSLVEMTIPFVGSIAGKTANNTYQYPFGYIFGTSSYTGGNSVTQYYYGSSTSSTTNTTYYIPSSLKSVTVTGGNILYGAFYGCSMLTSITTPDSVTSIGACAFYGCSGLTSITIPSRVTSIGPSAFSHCSGLTSITIPSSVTSIGSYAFSDCYNLTSITIPSSVTSIGSHAFSYCFSLTSVTIPSSVASIGSYAFSYCSSLTSVTIPSRVTSIEDSAFYYCSALTSIEIPSSVTRIGPSAFYGCSGMTSITIPSRVTSIGPSAFSHCSGLTSITIPSSVTSIDSCAFYCCSGLTSITIPDSVTSIGSYAFSGCSGLTSVSFANTSGWYLASSFTATSGTDMTVTNASTNAAYLKSTYYEKYYWKRK